MIHVKKFIAQISTLLLLLIFSLSGKAQVNDTLIVIMKMKAVNGIFTYNKYGTVDDPDLLWAVYIDTDDNLGTGQAGFDLQLSLSHQVESGGSMLGNILTATGHSAWKLTGSGATKIDTFTARMNIQDTLLVFHILKSIPEIAQVKKGNRFFAVALRKTATGYDIDSTDIGIVPAIKIDTYSDCSSSIHDIISVQVLNANSNSGIKSSGNENKTVNIYPQPMQTHAWIEFQVNNGELYHFQLVNAQGQIVREYNGIEPGSFRIDRNDLKAGVYFYHLVSDNNEVYRGKLFVSE